MAYPAVHVFEYQLVSFRRTWRGSVLGTFLMPVLFFVGIGYGVGGFVDANGGLGVSYLAYLAPGLLASGAFQVAVNESSWPVLGSFIWHRSYHAMIATPLRVLDVLLGHVAFVVLRVLLASVAYLLVMLAFGVVGSPWAAALPPVAVLLGLAYAAPVFAYSARIENDSLFSVVFRFVVIPLTLFSGVFFPVSQVPVALRPLAYASPLWHGVEVCRALTLGPIRVPPLFGHLAFLAAVAGLGLWLAHRAFHRRLAV